MSASASAPVAPMPASPQSKARSLSAETTRIGTALS